MNLYTLKATLLLPFRAWLPGPELKGCGRFLRDEWDTEISLGHPQSFRVLAGQIDASLCTIADVTTFLAFEGDKEAAKTWARNHAPAIVADTVLLRLNEFLLQLKRIYPKAVLTGTVRNVGDVDLVYSYLFFEGECILSRSSPTLSSWHGVAVPEMLLAGTGPLPGPGPENAVLFETLAKEWVAITRAVDLVNHGYFEEALLVSFALLDALAQDFVKARLPHLSKEEADTLIGRIDTARLRTLLGPLLHICLGASPLEDKDFRTDLDWLNRKRNAVLHGGQFCSRVESQRGVAVVWRLLRYLSENGADYSLPPALEFWTPEDVVKRAG